MNEFDCTIKEIYQSKQRNLKKFKENIKKENKKAAIFGAGYCGHYVYEMFKSQDILISFFIDNKLGGGREDNNVKDKQTQINIVTLDYLLENKSDYWIIISVIDEKLYEQIRKQLLDNGFEKSQIFDMKSFSEIFKRFPITHIKKYEDKYREVYNLLEDDFSKKVYLEVMKNQFIYNDDKDVSIVSPEENQYFDKNVVLSDNEVFVDCGGFDGETSLQFINKCNKDYKKIIIFEPLLSKKEIIETNLEKEKYILYPYGLWDKKCTLCFNDLENTMSHIVDTQNSNGENVSYFYGTCSMWSENHTLQSNSLKNIESVVDSKINVVSLDDIIYDEKPTFIKMDIEGSELRALKGSINIIKDYKPKLAICIYHKPEDFYEIPLFIKSLVSEYKLYIRQYDKDGVTETVCYAL